MTSDDTEKEAFWKNWEKNRKCCWSIPTLFSTIKGKKISFWVTLMLLLCQQLLFLHALAEVWGENTLVRKFVQTGIKLLTTRSWVLHPHHWADRVGQKLEKGQMMESEMDTLTLPAQLKTKPILCRPKRRLKRYIGLVIKILVIQLQFNHLHVRALQ